jgi:hypothetical protein
LPRSYYPENSQGPGKIEFHVEAMPELLKNGNIAGVKHLYAGHRPADYEGLVKDLPPETARECYREAEPELNSTVWDSGNRMVLYKAGTIWSVPPDVYVLNGDLAALAAEDLKWLFHRLGAAPAGAPEGSQPTHPEINRTSSVVGFRR